MYRIHLVKKGIAEKVFDFYAGNHIILMSELVREAINLQKGGKEQEMIRRYVEQIMNLYNFIDGLVVVNAKGFIEYFITYRSDVNTLKESDVVGRHILDVYPTLTEDSSSLLRVLKTGEPIFNEYQSLCACNGQSINAINTTMPIKDGEKIIGAVDVSRYVDELYQRQDITLELKAAPKVTRLYTVDDIITVSQKMELVKERIRMIADTDSTVMIYGETGTGKELAAQSLHTSSRRRKKRFVSQNCASIPANLLESILFGTVKGSYTGAENRPGLFELANGGTLFLDEINSMEVSVQAKILKAIEEKQITRIGGLEPIPVDVKIVSAVNQPPRYCVSSGKLREDLFYRLSVVQLSLPPLRERSNDLLFLVNHFIQEFNEKMNRQIIGIDEEVEKLFCAYSWPGNVRELRNVIEGAFNVTAGGFIRLKDLPEYLTDLRIWEDKNREKREHIDMNDPAFSLTEKVEELEKSLINQALEETSNMSQAAKRLKISKQVLSYKMNKYGL